MQNATDLDNELKVIDMGNQYIPHPVPYQGSKRKLCTAIAANINRNYRTLYEPFAGSASFSLYAAKHHLATRFVIGDSLAPLIELWKLIVFKPSEVSKQYELVWKEQLVSDEYYYNEVRSAYNASKNPILLLYLITRCVKNAVRFNRQGDFTQSRDKRRLGMHPNKMREAVYGASTLLMGKVEFFVGDFKECLEEAKPSDLVYLDPPYQGTTYGKDKRYFQQLSIEKLCTVLRTLNDREIPFLLSYDGNHGEKEYGIELPEDLFLHRTLLNAGRSSQATLNGKEVITFEALYSSPYFRASITRLTSEQPKQLSLSI